MPVTASSPSAMTSAKATLQKYFEIVDPGLVKWLLGIWIECDHPTQTIALSQTAYIDSIIAQFKLEDRFKVKTPMDTNVILSKNLSPTSEEAKRKMEKIPYLSVVGSLMCASMATHSDITYTISHLGNYSANPG